MAYHVVYVTGKHRGEKISISEGVATLGRSSTADITVKDHKISRIHCQIELTGDGCSVTDLNSTNGTFVNGKRVSEQTLQHGDHISIGLTPLRFLEDPPPADLPKPSKMKFCDECGGSVAAKEILRGDATWIGDKLVCGDCIKAGVIRRAREASREERRKRKGESANGDDEPDDDENFSGEQIGPYKVGELIGEGELGPVYRAEQTTMHRTVVLKILSEAATSDESWLKSYLREANLAGQLVHPNILLIYDIGTAEGVHYIAMEHVDGDSMATVLKKQKSLSVKRSLGVAVQIAQAVEHAFEHKIPHRDIKPANVLLDRSSTAKLGGFGTSYLLSSNPPRRIRSEERDLANFLYAAPEFFREDEDLDFRSDMYSLGATFYHMMTGRPPFEAESLKDLAPKVRAKQPKPPREIASGFPESLCRIIEKAMAKDPEDRYQVPKELLWDLQEASKLE